MAVSANNLMAELNNPDLWLKNFPWPTPVGNKYDRGHAAILGGALGHTGAAKLAADCALRSGAGLVSVICDADNLVIYAQAFQAVMTPKISVDEFPKFIQDRHVRSILIGPGAGIAETIKSYVLSALSQKKPTVLDADALTVFANNPNELFAAIQPPCILTPHEGEFQRLFPNITQTNKTERAQAAAKLSNAIIILKGSDTIIAAPDGRTVINKNASPFLATAGSGDCLAGICTGLIAQKMPTFEAACATVWLHSYAAAQFGPGLIADDIPRLLPKSLAELYRRAH